MSHTAQVSPPWVTYVHEVEAMFEEDPDVKVVYDNDGPEVKLFVNGQDKADALSKMLISEKHFGNVTLKVTVIPANEDTPEAIIRKAFAGNGAVERIETLDDDVLFFGGRTFVMFRPQLVQFFNDDLGDYNGICTTLHQDIARDMFDFGAKVAFCTSLMVE